jgi:hypothetical protein
MRYINQIISAFILVLLYSCNNNKDQAKDLVSRFLTETSDAHFNRKSMDYSIFTSDFKAVFDSSGYYPLINPTLSIQSESDSMIVVISKGTATNVLGVEIEDQQEFRLKNIQGNWKIDNSNNFLVDHANFKFVGDEYEQLWDKEQSIALNQVQENVLLEVVKSPEGFIFSDSRNGMFKLINNSDFDIRKLRISIEHFDSEGHSVNTDEEIVHDVIRKHGYRVINWFSKDCLNCDSQKFKVIFVDEND